MTLKTTYNSIRITNNIYEFDQVLAKLDKIIRIFHPTKNAQREMYSTFRTTWHYQSQDQE